MIIVIDAGHGGHDPGVVYNGVLEKDLTLAYALTLKWILVNNGYKVILTRGEDFYPSFPVRTAYPADLYISLHFNSAGTYPLIYYQQREGWSLTLAESLDRYFNSGKLWSTVRSRFGRLYIDDVKAPAVLVEVDAIDKVQNTRENRITFAEIILEGIKHFDSLIKKSEVIK